MDIVLVGMNHRSAPLEVRERLAVGRHALCDVLCGLKVRTGLCECSVISTCNRVEVYGVTEEWDKAVQSIEDFLSQHSGQPRSLFERNLYAWRQPESVRHIFRVASGLDAMMVGEKEIVAQVKEAYEKAATAQCVGSVLNALFQRAMRASKRVRTETRVDIAAVSVSSAAVELARKIFGVLADKTVMIIGAGQTAEQTLAHLAQCGTGSVMASNRSFEKAQELAERFGGRAMRLDEGIQELGAVDIVISSTAAPRTLIGKDAVRQAMKRRRNRPLFLIDIAVPRDIDAEVNRIDNVYLYNIDDLQEMAEINLQRREVEVARGERIVDEEVAGFMAWLRSREAAPLIRRLHERFESVRTEELQRALAQLPGLSEDVRSKVERMTQRMVKRLLHDPSTRIKGVARTQNGAATLGVMAELFGLDEEKREDT